MTPSGTNVTGKKNYGSDASFEAQHLHIRLAQVESTHTTKWNKKTQIEKKTKNILNAGVTDENTSEKAKLSLKDTLFYSYQSIEHFEMCCIIRELQLLFWRFLVPIEIEVYFKS